MKEAKWICPVCGKTKEEWEYVYVIRADGRKMCRNCALETFYVISYIPKDLIIEECKNEKNKKDES